MEVFPNARTLAEDLVGQTIFTLGHDKPNTIIAVHGENVVVGTTKSPGGKPVPLGTLQLGLDALEETGEFRVRPESLNQNRRSSFVGAAIATLPNVAVEHRPQIRLLADGATDEASARDVVSGGDAYPDPNTTRVVDAAGVKVAMQAIIDRYRDQRVIEMPHNNAGFDVRVVDEKRERCRLHRDQEHVGADTVVLPLGEGADVRC